MPKIFYKDKFQYKREQNRVENTLLAAKLMLNSAFTAPFTGGTPTIEAELVHGEDELEEIAREMERLASLKRGEIWENIFKYEAVMVRESDAVIFLGSYRAAQSPLDAECGLCGGVNTCAHVYERRRHKFGVIDMTDRKSGTLINGPLCTNRVMDLGYAAGSALRMAVNLHIDSKCFMSTGLAGMNLDYCKNSFFVVGIPVAAFHKNPYVDIDPDYHLINMSSIIDTVRETAVVTRLMLGSDYRKWDPSVEFVYTPCESACPIHVDACGYVALISHGKYEEAIHLHRKRNPLLAVCGRVCHHPCEDKCVRAEHDEPVAILAIKRTLSDYGIKNNIKTPIEIKVVRDEKVAIVGSGPAGLNCAFHLARKGYKVTIFEKNSMVGGMLSMGIPCFRLPKEVLQYDLDFITSYGVEIKTNSPIGKTLTIDDLFKQKYKAVFIATGAHKGAQLKIPGENLKGVIDGMTFLKDVNSRNKIGKLDGSKVAVIGGGNAAVDTARSAIRLGAKEVSILYRRTREEMPAIKEDIEEAIDEGVKIIYLVAPKRFESDKGKVKRVVCTPMELGDPDEGGRRKPMPRDLSELSLDFDLVIVSVGQIPNLTFLSENITITPNGTIAVDPITLATSKKGTFAGGDVTSEGRGRVIHAMEAGERAARFIDKYIKGEPMVADGEVRLPEKRDEITRADEIPKGTARESVTCIPLEKRTATFEEVSCSYSEVSAIREAKRCVRCDLERGTSAMLFRDILPKVPKDEPEK